MRAACERTLEPAWARSYEPPSLSGHETVGVVRFLVEIEQPTPAIVAAVEGAVAWLEAVAIRGLRLEAFTDAEGRPDRRVVADPAAGPLWARFYELGTNRPIFLGRDSVVRDRLDEIERERRAGYAYYGSWPATLLAEDFPRWREKHARRSADSATVGQWEVFEVAPKGPAEDNPFARRMSSPAPPASSCERRAVVSSGAP